MEETSLILRIFSKQGDPENVMLTLTAFSQDETSEMFIGEWAEARGIRDQLFIATKVGFLINANDDYPETLTYFFLLHFQLQAS